jgi:hypothetical protein
MIIPERLPAPWQWDDTTDLSKELTIEVSKKHVLHGARVKTIARRQDMDDVLFEVDNREYKYAVVHLTWLHHEERNPWPLTRLYKDWNDVFNNKILPDSEGWE